MNSVPLGSLYWSILERNDLKQIVSSQNNKMILFYFHGSVKHFNIVNACSVVDLILNIKSRTRLLK